MNKLLRYVFILICCGSVFISCNKKIVLKLESGSKYELVPAVGRNFYIGKTEMTQEFYESVMEANPSFNKQPDFPVENVSWFDAIVFCNVLSEKLGRTPCYSVNGNTDVSKWGYVPHRHELLKSKIDFAENADGFHIPTMDEWDYAIRGGEKFEYSGSNDLDSVAWTDCNAGGSSHKVASFKPNGFGIYDMSGNVLEWVWSVRDDSSRYCRGGSWYNRGNAGKCTNKELKYA